MMGEEEGSVSSWRLVVTIDIVCQSHSGGGAAGGRLQQTDALQQYERAAIGRHHAGKDTKGCT